LALKVSEVQPASFATEVFRALPNETATLSLPILRMPLTPENDAAFTVNTTLLPSVPDAKTMPPIAGSFSPLRAMRPSASIVQE
jgi:hypothetical protein